MKILPRHIIVVLHIVVWLFLFFVAMSVQIQDYGWANSFWRSSVNLSLIFVVFYGHFYLINQFFEKKNFWIYGVLLIMITVSITIIRVYFNEEIMRLPEHLHIIKEQSRAEIQYLKAQINPHFLFNSLNNIYSLSVIQSKQTPEMVLKLSSLLRYAIYEGEKKKVSLEKEVEQIKEYIALFQMKSEEPLKINFNVEGNLSSKEIEPMLLIPLVENCFKHGGFEEDEKAFANIDIQVDEHKIIFKTENSISSNLQKDEVGGVGLENIKRRLEANYGKNQKIDICENENTYIVSLEIFS